MSLNPYRRRLMTAAVCCVCLVLVVYASLLNRTSKSSSSSSANEDNNSSSKLRINSNQNYVTGLKTLKAVEILEKSALNSQNCPHMKPATETPGKPLWIAGYPGSGFDLVAHLISAVTGLTSVDIYRQHSCSVAVKEGAAPTGACLTHWPLVQQDSPASVAVATGNFYNKQAVFVLRNPADAIPSYHTRWWGAQQLIRGNHDQPDQKEWIEWRNKRFARHLQIWALSLTEWQRGVPAAGITGIALYLPYDQLVDVNHGPVLTNQLAQTFQSAHHPAAANTACLWRRIVDEEHHSPKVYAATYSAAHKELLLKTMDDLMVTYATKEPRLTEILRGYSNEIARNLPLDIGE